MATDDDAIPGLIEEDLEIAYDPTASRGTPRSPQPAAGATRASPDGRAAHARLTAHTRPTGEISVEELERQTDVAANPGRPLRDTLEMEIEAVDALIMLSRKDAEDLENLEGTMRESRRSRPRTS